MKVTTEHYELLQQAIEPLDTPIRRMAYLSGQFPHAEHVKDLDMRYRWDLFYDIRPGRLFDLIDYHDNHIDTALKNIVPALDKSVAGV